MVVAAAQLREDFGIGRLPPITTRQLATGPAEPPLVLVPSITPLGGPAEFDAWRTPLSGVRDAVVVAHPGFAAGEPVPRDLDALLAAHAAALVRDDLADVVLCGHSSGGWLAHALAHRLLADGHHPAGVVLVDALWPDDRLHDVLVPRLWELLSRGPLGDVDTGRLTAAGQYLRLMRGWEPPPSTLPTLLVTAQESLFLDERPTPWQRTAERVTVAGDHLTMMSAHGSEVVAAVQQWLTSRDPARSTPTRAVAGNPSTGGHR
jgi:thioesterase domain-containing protein